MKFLNCITSVSVKNNSKYFKMTKYYFLGFDDNWIVQRAVGLPGVIN